MDNHRTRALFLVWLLVASGFLGLLTFTDSLDRPATAIGESYLSGFAYRKQHLILGQSGAGTNYIVYLDIHSGAGADNDKDVYLDTKCNNFPQDIRFTNSGGITELIYFVENISADPARIYIKITDDLNSNAYIYIYYGHVTSNLATTSDTTTTFFTSKFNFTMTQTSFTSWGGGTSFVRQVNNKVPTRYGGNPVFTYDSSYCTTEINRICIIKESASDWKMWYSGKRGTDYYICYATSTDGISWSDYGSNPLLSKSMGFETSGLGDAWVCKYNGIYQMLYVGWDATPVYKIGYASSPDGITWTKFSGNPITSLGTGGSFNEKGYVTPSFFRSITNAGWIVFASGKAATGLYVLASGSVTTFSSALTLTVLSGTAKDPVTSWESSTCYGAAYYPFTTDCSIMFYTGTTTGAIGFGRASNNGIDLVVCRDKILSATGVEWEQNGVSMPSPVWLGLGQGWRVYYIGTAASGGKSIGYFTLPANDDGMWIQTTTAGEFDQIIGGTSSRTLVDNYIAEGKVEVASGSNAARSAGIIGKGYDTSTWVAGNICPGTGNFELLKKYGTSTTSLGTYAASATNGVVYRVGIAIVDNNIYAYLNDVLRISVVSNEITMALGNTGFRTSLCVAYALRDIHVRPYVYPEPVHSSWGIAENIRTPYLINMCSGPYYSGQYASEVGVYERGPLTVTYWNITNVSTGALVQHSHGGSPNWDTTGEGSGYYDIDWYAESAFGEGNWSNVTVFLYPWWLDVDFANIVSADVGDNVTLYQDTITGTPMHYNWTIIAENSTTMYTTTGETVTWNTTGVLSGVYVVQLDIDDYTGQTDTDWYYLLLYPEGGADIWFFNWTTEEFDLIVYHNTTYIDGGSTDDDDDESLFYGFVSWFEDRIPNPLIGDDSEGGDSLAVHFIWIALVGAAVALVAFFGYTYAARWWRSRQAKRRIKR